jgi:putative endonuclease
VVSTTPGSTRTRGRAWEDRAADLLENSGLEVLERNVEMAHAEIDLVARLPASSADDVDTIVFVEVRSRSRGRHGDPLETVDSRKRRQIARASKAWLVARGLWERVAVRFDVIGIVESGGAEPTIRWIPDAFDAA